MTVVVVNIVPLVALIATKVAIHSVDIGLFFQIYHESDDLRVPTVADAR